MLNESTKYFHPPSWSKNTPEYEPIDGESYIIAVHVYNNKTGEVKWQFEQVQVVVYDDGISLYQGEDPFTDWEWEDVEYFLRCF